MSGDSNPKKGNSKPAEGFNGFGLPTGNTTYTPNQFFDVCLPRCSRGTVRLVAYLIRKTLGWSDAYGRPQAEQHQVSFTEFVSKAGISRDMVKAAVEEATRAHLIRRLKLGRPNSAGKAAVSATYELCWDDRLEYIKDPHRFRGFFAGEGNRTYIPNQFFDVVIPSETLAVIKVVGSVMRFSIGFQTKWGHRRQLVSLSYKDMRNYTRMQDRSTLASAIRKAIESNYLLRLEHGVFDPNAGRLSRPATYALKWLDSSPESPNVQKTRPEKKRSKTQTENGQKTRPVERSEIQTDIQITDTNNILKQQADARLNKQTASSSALLEDSAVAFERLKSAGFDAKAAQAIASRFELDRIEHQIGWIDQRAIKSNRLGMLRVAIEQNWSPPTKSRISHKDPPRSVTQPTRSETGASFTQSLEVARRRFLRSSSNPT